MKIGFVINQTHKEQADYTTTLLALRALQLGHDICYIGLADFYYTENQVAAHVRYVHADQVPENRAVLLDILRNTAKSALLMKELDVLWLRFDPVLDMVSRPWAATAGLQFAQFAQNEGVYVVNNPEVLSQASNKLYLEKFDRSIRPDTMVTRKYQDVLDFYEGHQEQIILKPLKGSGGKNVFLMNKDNKQNLKQTVEAIARDGYVIAQEYLPKAVQGDIRFFLLNGKPIQVNGKYASVQRVQQQGEIRSNVHQGATVQAATIDNNLLQMVDRIADQLLQDGMYFVGLDIVGDKIMEINVYSPGALIHAEKIGQEDFSAAIINDLEKRISSKIL